MSVPRERLEIKLEDYSFYYYYLTIQHLIMQTLFSFHFVISPRMHRQFAFLSHIECPIAVNDNEENERKIFYEK